MTTGMLAAVRTTPFPELGPADRCQAGGCAAPAYVLVDIPVMSSDHSLDVRYCGHHYNERAAGLAEVGAHVVQDHRHLING